MSNYHSAAVVSDPDDAVLPRRSNILAFAEGILMLGGLAFLGHSGLVPFASWPVHPFLFAVILLSAQYGIQGGILAAVGAIVLSHLDGWPARPIDMAYAEYFRIAWADSLSWVLAALTVGIVTSHRGRILREQTIKLQKATMAENLIAEQYQVLAQRTHKLERSLAGRAAESLFDAEAPSARESSGKSAKRSRMLRQSQRWAEEPPVAGAS